MMSEDLLDILQDLTNEELQSFNWFLQQPGCLEGHAPIKKCRLQKENRLETVTVMEQSYEIPVAVQVTWNILGKIDRKDLQQKLDGIRNTGPPFPHPEGEMLHPLL